MINTQNISVINLKKEAEGFCSFKKVLPNEVGGISIEYISMKGPHQISDPAFIGFYNVLLSLNGEANVELENSSFKVGNAHIVKLPYNNSYILYVEKGKEFHFLSFRKSLDQADQDIISQNRGDHSKVYIRAINECSVYTEDIKSSKTLNRMILPEGKVPRFCMGSVKTEGPDEVAEHEHPMLDQLFFGLEGCKCICVADGEETTLIENMMLHIPLGSKHSVTVKEGETLSYIWMDFFLTLEGQKYMNEQHLMEREQNRANRSEITESNP